MFSEIEYDIVSHRNMKALLYLVHIYFCFGEIYATCSINMLVIYIKIWKYWTLTIKFLKYYTY